MKRSLIMLISLFVSAGAMAQTSDASLIREASFSDERYEETVPDNLSAFGRFAVTMNRQLTGECYFEPECHEFVIQAIKEFGFLPGLIITTDRLTRCSRIGTAAHHHFSEDGLIHEGTEAYRPKRRKAE